MFLGVVMPLRCLTCSFGNWIAHVFVWRCNGRFGLCEFTSGLWGCLVWTGSRRSFTDWTFDWILGLTNHTLVGVSGLFQFWWTFGRSTAQFFLGVLSFIRFCMRFALFQVVAQPLRSHKAPVHKGGMRHLPLWYLLMLLLRCRLGEALVPGPTWSLAVINPAGLPGKAHLLSQFGDVNLVSETHLSSQGFRAFKGDLGHEKSSVRWCLAGKHVQPRSTSSNHGNWGGVGIFSRYPTRALPNAFSPTAIGSSRLVCGTTCIGKFWISGIVMYGVPKGPTHPKARLNTDSLLGEALSCLRDIDGPKYLAGDFNHDLCDLPAAQLLSDLGMIEIQDLFCQQTGIQPRPTCRGRTRRDFLFISHHLVPHFRHLVVDPHSWVDHSALIAQFACNNDDFVRFPWKIPAHFDWRLAGDLSPAEAVSFDAPVDCTKQYAHLWKTFEHRFQTALQNKGQQLPQNACGRASKLKPSVVKGTPALPKVGRQGECQPSYFGCSYLHCHWFRQLRRLQSLTRLVADGPSSTMTLAKRERCLLLWSAILNAPGFVPSFGEWWKCRLHTGDEPSILPLSPPNHKVADLIFQAMEWETRQLESRLKRERKTNRRNQVGQGLSRLYASVRRDAPASVDVLIEPLTSKVTQICPEDCAIEVDPPREWDPERNITCDGSLLSCNMITPDKLYVQDLSGIEQGAMISQTKCTGDLPAVFEAFREQWARRWNRHEGVPLSHWSTLLQFAQDQLPTGSFEPLRITVPLVRAVTKAKKTKSAVGLDGVGRADVLAMDANQLQSLVNMFNRAHHDGTWPRQVTQGSVASLAKRLEPRGVGDYRPITVFSLAYRIWSSLQSQFWLQKLDSNLHPTLLGNRGSRRAADLWRLILREVEDSHADMRGTCGVIFDLEKAFNMLPRAICLAFVKILGMDQLAMQGWAGALGAMERHFIIRGSASPPSMGTCGFPEGCGLSCLAMLALDMVWHCWLRFHLPLAASLSFVGNWEVVTTSPEQIKAAFDRTLEFTRALDLVLDASKSFCWATDSGQRHELRAAGFVVKLDAGDLGAHLTYSRQVRNRSLIERFHNLEDFWLKLSGASGLHEQKMMVIRQAAWPRAMHGIAATIVGRKRFHDLRVCAVRSLGLEKPGANAWLQMHVEKPGSDPQFFALEQTIRDFRDLTGGDAGIEAFTRCVSDPSAFAPNSVTSVLISRLHWLGWCLLPEAWVRDDFGVFSLLLAPWAEVRWRLLWGWRKVVSQQVVEKVDFDRVIDVDPWATTASLESFNPYDRGILTRYLNGTTCTNEHAYHWSSDGSDRCVFCNGRDSLMHRFWECLHHGDLRKDLSNDLIASVATLPAVLTLHSWTLRSCFAPEWISYLVSIPEVPDEPLCGFDSSATWDIFTDGSCLWQDQPNYRLASWAVCIADPISTNTFKSHIAAAGPLPGVCQTSFRAECYALLRAIRIVKEFQVSARIWTDCQGVLDRYLLVCHGRLRIKPKIPLMLTSGGKFLSFWMKICLRDFR